LKDTFREQLTSIPYFRALLRAVEARFYDGIELPSPTLDLGCGDGHFASLAFDRHLDVGLDPWLEPLQEAAHRDVYRLVTAAEGARMPFPEGYFASAVSNSVLEHIADVEAVLKDLARVMQQGARFVFCVPNHRFPEMLSVGRIFDTLNLKGLGEAYRRFFNRISRHQHCDPPDVWQSRLQKSGFIIDSWWDYFSPGSLRVLEWGHYLGLPSWLSRQLFGRWILVASDWNLALTRKFLQPYYSRNPKDELGAYTFYITRRI